MYFSEAVAQEIDRQGRSLLTEHDFFLLAYRVYQSNLRSQISVQNPPRKFDQIVARRTIRQLERRRLIVRDPDFRGEVWQALRAPPIPTAEEAICLIDPFAYVAFLSAFERHGMTNRSPKSLQILTYSSPQWGKERKSIMRAEIPLELVGESIPAPIHIRPKPVVRRRPIDIFHTKNLGETRIVRNTAIRMATIGQTFLDSLEQPKLCGGMRHVIQIWREHSLSYIDEIIELFDKRANSINKVRAGYILENYAKVEDPRVQLWVKYAQRGGSRKLDPLAAYAPKFSEKWMISLNV